MLLMQPVLERKSRLSVSWVVKAGTPTHAVLDATRTVQIVIKLLANAVKFSSDDEGGSVVLEVSAVSADGRAQRNSTNDPGSFICFRVVDTGIGIDPENIPRIFEPFSQARGGPQHARGRLGSSKELRSRLSGHIS